MSTTRGRNYHPDDAEASPLAATRPVRRSHRVAACAVLHNDHSELTGEPPPFALFTLKQSLRPTSMELPRRGASASVPRGGSASRLVRLAWAAYQLVLRAPAARRPSLEPPPDCTGRPRVSLSDTHSLERGSPGTGMEGVSFLVRTRMCTRIRSVFLTTLSFCAFDSAPEFGPDGEAPAKPVAKEL
jgi:hypothetical protein